MAIPTMLRLGDLVIHLMVVCDDIDEDDRDAILVRTLVQNPTKNRLKSPTLNIKTSGADVKIFKSLESQLGANSQDDAFHFLPMRPGAWILTAEHLGKQGELGPFPGDYRMEIDLEEIPVLTEISEDILSDVFEDALSGFGIEELLPNNILKISFNCIKLAFIDPFVFFVVEVAFTINFLYFSSSCINHISQGFQLSLFPILNSSLRYSSIHSMNG